MTNKEIARRLAREYAHINAMPMPDVHSRYYREAVTARSAALNGLIRDVRLLIGTPNNNLPKVWVDAVAVAMRAGDDAHIVV